MPAVEKQTGNLRMEQFMDYVPERQNEESNLSIVLYVLLAIAVFAYGVYEIKIIDAKITTASVFEQTVAQLDE